MLQPLHQHLWRSAATEAIKYEATIFRTNRRTRPHNWQWYSNHLNLTVWKIISWYSKLHAVRAGQSAKGINMRPQQKKVGRTRAVGFKLKMIINKWIHGIVLTFSLFHFIRRCNLLQFKILQYIILYSNCIQSKGLFINLSILLRCVSSYSFWDG